MQPLSPKPYTVQPGDTLTSIAKKTGFSNWTDIYNNPANMDFRSRRPDPNQLRPGDQVMIPPTPQMLRQVLQSRLDDLLRLRQQSDSLFSRIEADLDADLAKYDVVATGADLAATVAEAVPDIVALAASGWKALKLSGPALGAVNKELAKHGVSVAVGFLQDPALQFVANELGAHEGSLWVFGKVGLEAISNIQSPSWWAGIYGSMRDGKTWAQAVNTSPEEQLQATRDQIELQRSRVLESIDTRIRETRKLLQDVADKGLTALSHQPSR